MEDYLSCQICFHLFGEGVKCPRMLHCGHSFCHSCLEKRMSANVRRTCPMCNALISVKGPHALPINYLIKGMATSPSPCLKRIKLEHAPASSSSTHVSCDGIEKCPDHGESKKFRCMQCVTWICGTCATLLHKNCRTLLMEDALEEIKTQFNNKYNNDVEANETQINYVSNFIKICSKRMSNFNKEVLKIIASRNNTQEWMSKLTVLRSDQTIFSSKLKALGVAEKVSSDVNELAILEATNKLEKFMENSKEKLAKETSLLLEFKNLLTFQDLMALCEMDLSMYVVTKQNEDNKYGKVTIKPNKIYVHAFSSQKPTGKPLFLPYDDLLKRFNESQAFTKRAFLQISVEKPKWINKIKTKVSEVAGEIIVMVDDVTTPRAKNFLSFCSGIKGDSYLSKVIDKGSRFGFVSYSFNPSQSIGTILKEETKALVDGINESETYKAVIKTGSVMGCNAKTEKDKLSGFHISCVDVNKISNCKFGAIEEGMLVCLQVFEQSYPADEVLFIVTDCGSVISVS